MLRASTCTQAVYGQQMSGISRIVLQSLSKPEDAIVHGAGVGIGSRIPDFVQGFVPASDMKARRMIFCRALSGLMTRIRSPHGSQFCGWRVHRNPTFPDNTESRSSQGDDRFWEGRTAKATAAVACCRMLL